MVGMPRLIGGEPRPLQQLPPNAIDDSLLRVATNVRVEVPPSTSCGTPCARAPMPPLNLTAFILAEDLATRYIAGRPGRRPRDTNQRAEQWGRVCEGYRCHFLGRMHRGRIANLLLALNYTGDSAEVGFLTGGSTFSQRLLAAWGGGVEGVHTIADTYKCLLPGDARYGGFAGFCGANATATQQRYDKLHSQMSSALTRRFGKRVSMSRDPNASRLVRDSSLSFIHLDARDDATGGGSILDDLRAWWPKLCPGGLLVGHDWTTAMPSHKRVWMPKTRKWTPKHAVAMAVRRFISEIEPEDDDDREQSQPDARARTVSARMLSEVNCSQPGDCSTWLPRTDGTTRGRKNDSSSTARIRTPQRHDPLAPPPAHTPAARSARRVQRALGLTITADHPASFLMFKAPEAPCAVVV